MKSQNKLSFASEIPLPQVPKSLVFSSNNPFARVRLEDPIFDKKYSENIEEENYPHLNANLSLTIMNQKKNSYFNQKILEFNENKKPKQFHCLSEELRETSSFSFVDKFASKQKLTKKFAKFTSYLTERTEEPSKDFLNNNLINDTLDFLKKMQNYDLLEDEFLNGEKQEFERNEEYLKICAQAVRESQSKSSKEINSAMPIVSLNKGLTIIFYIFVLYKYYMSL